MAEPAYRQCARVRVTGIVRDAQGRVAPRTEQCRNHARVYDPATDAWYCKMHVKGAQSTGMRGVEKRWPTAAE